MAKKRLTVDQVTLEMVKHSDYGCMNCLQDCISCKNAEKFSPAVTRLDGEPTCGAYVFYD